MKIVITGAGGLLGWHAAVRLHAQNCAARFRGEDAPHEVVALDRSGFSDPTSLANAVRGADVILHFAGVNRAPDAEMADANPAIARTLVDACHATGATPHIVYANSTHAGSDTVYGRSKSGAAAVFSSFTDTFTDLILPHIFGECARPDYNNVTATFIDRIIRGEKPEVNPDGRVSLLHAGRAAQLAIDAGLAGVAGQSQPEGRDTTVGELLAMLKGFHADYSANIFPALDDPFHVALFNSYRTALYPGGFPRPLKLNTDPRGTLFEAVKGGSGGQTFLSWTETGVTRGDHFHLNKVERFLVLEGQATLRIRRALFPDVWTYEVSGAAPAPVDMPTLHTHSIENTGSTPLLTLFWTHEVFDPAAPDTYADPVLQKGRPC
ncbi:polysaccharide biosynthesis C-terminal domain-containing protein [Oceanibium sediminis]|uniref:polysaccharide biosynthesis C-terminal domain-containing protein n=1 Tax=Oceanibium sediminis TaxID=2026339 RepID=UPI000DD368AC|nr:NAD-dependent epimerase/dehydratase family protein [Oceanibium sediminis]